MLPQVPPRALLMTAGVKRTLSGFDKRKGAWHFAVCLLVWFSRGGAFTQPEKCIFTGLKTY